MSLTTKSNQKIMSDELKYRIARNSAFIQMGISGVLAPFTNCSSLLSWAISVPKFGYNLYKGFRAKLERIKRGLPRPKGSLSAAYLTPIAAGVGLLVGVGKQSQ